MWDRRLSTAATASLGAVFIALMVGYILAGARQETFTFVFAPSTTAEAQPAVAGLALARAVPDSATITLPCDPGSEFSSSAVHEWALVDPGDGSLQHPISYENLLPGLVLAVLPSSVDVIVGDAEVLSVPIGPDTDCFVELHYASGRYNLLAGSASDSADGPEPLFSEASFAGPAATSRVAGVTVTTRELGTSPSGLQMALLLAAAVVLTFLVRQILRYDDRMNDRSEGAAKGWPQIGLADAAVLGGIVMWVFLIPPYFDDGWVVAIQRSFEQHGAFSAVFENQAAISPLGYWLGWVQNLLFGLTTTPLLMRIPVGIIGVVTWLLLRKTALEARLVESAWATWVLALVFVTGFGAWGVTLRPEPVISLLLVASTLLAIRFVDRPRATTLLGSVGIVALAITAHPAGVIAAAPLLASAGAVYRWVRSDRDRFFALASIGAVFIGVVLILLFFDSDLGTKADSLGSRSGRHSNSILDEALRYRMLVNAPSGTPMRLATVMLGFVAIAAFVVSSSEDRRGIRGIPGRSLVWGFALLSLTPSKWPWHLGGLMGLIALAMAAYLLSAGRRSFGRRPGPAVTSLLIMVVMAWSWSRNEPWASFDLRTQQWWIGAVNLLPVDLSSVTTWAVLGGVIAGVVALLRFRRRTIPWTRFPGSLVVVATLLLIGVTASTFMLDAIRTPGWTFSRQNLNNALGRADCGLIDEFQIPVSGSIHELPTAPETSEPTSEPGFAFGAAFGEGGFPSLGYNEILPVSGMHTTGSWLAGLSPEAARGGSTSEWFTVDAGSDHVALMVMGSFEDLEGAEVSAGGGNAVGIEWGSGDGSLVEVLGAEYPDLWRYYSDWNLVMFDRPSGADRVRLLLRDDTVEDGFGWVASSMPLGLSTAPLRSVIAEPYPPDVVVTPPLMLYLPCVPIPPFDGPVVLPPDVMILQRPDPWETTYASAASVDRYFSSPIVIPLDRDVDQVEFFFSQEYLTGSPARVNGEFRLVDDSN